MRRHRWIRGDWQISCWLLPRVPIMNQNWQTNPLSWLAKWKIFDNLRRSLVPPAALTLLMIGWLALPDPMYFTRLLLLFFAIPVVTATVADAANKHRDDPLKKHLQINADAASRRILRAILAIIFLPFEAATNVDAIAKSLTRMLLTHRHLLAWRSASDPRHCFGGGWWPVLRSMMIAPCLALIIAGWIWETNPAALSAAGAFLILWLLSPAVAIWLSRHLTAPSTELSVAQIDFLRRLARKTWRYFETFVGPDDHWLPPDNFQESPKQILAHRTSPTNIGMSLIANLSAYDFGFISQADLTMRTSETFRTLVKLDRFKGHFYNWYDTQTLKPLTPQYVSTVDSGNLAGFLLTLRSGLIEIRDDKIITKSTYSGLYDTISCLGDSPTISTEVKAKLWQLQLDVANAPDSLVGAKTVFDRLMTTFKELDHFDDEEAQWWLTTLTKQAQHCLGDTLAELAPWTDLSLISNASWQTQLFDLTAIPSLREIMRLYETQIPIIDALSRSDANGSEHLSKLRIMLESASKCAESRLAMMTQLADQCEELPNFDYDFLYDHSRHLLAIGYNVTDHRRDDSYYDLLASEARLGSFV